MDSTGYVIIYYSGGSTPEWDLMLGPPTDTIPADIILGITDGRETKPVTLKNGLSYPNPTNSFTTIKTKNRKGDILLFDTNGKVAGRFEEDRIDLSKFKSGAYFAVWKDENEWVGTKIELVK